MHRTDRLLLAAAVVVLVVASAWVPLAAAGDPQATLLNLGCSQYNATPTGAFLAALNSTFAGLRANLSSGGGDGFATAAEPRAAAPAFALAQCRPYVTGGDCVACFDAAASRLRASCGAANGGRVILDGCVVRYESAAFFDQTTLPGNTQVCNGSAVAAGGFADAARALVGDLAAAVPHAPGFAAAAVSGSVYAAAQCVETVGEGGCAQCLEVAMSNIDLCPPNSDGRAVDAGCFMRYSNKPFFPANATIDLAPYLRVRSGKSNHKGAIIGGILGGVAFLFLLGLLAFLWIRRSRKLLKPRRGDILGATELQGPTSFYYQDLKAATSNFSEKNKLGEGGFGDVFKAWKLYENNNLIELVDKSLDPEEYNPEDVKRIMEIALLCTQSAVASRPTMSEVVVLLLTRNSSEFQPTRPTFIDATSRVRGETSSSSSSSASKATISITQFSAR
ncbi:hypothetical protein ABZP36_011682 [Zizania latifolia]